MRLDKTLTKPVVFEDVIFHVTRKARPQYEFMERVAALGDDATKLDYARLEDEYAQALVVRIENLYDGKGDAIETLDEDALLELPTEAKQAIIVGYHGGDAGNADSSGDKPDDGSPDTP